MSKPYGLRKLTTYEIRWFGSFGKLIGIGIKNHATRTYMP